MQIKGWGLNIQKNQSDATAAQSKTNRLMYSLTPLTFRWTFTLRG
jgi:hypothetical protein